MGERGQRGIRIVTLNIFGHHGPWERRRPILAEGFRRLDADIIALQEVITNDEYDQARAILGDGYHLIYQTRGKVDDMGIAIASRWPVTRVDEIDLHVTPRTRDFFCTTLLVEIDVPGPIGPVLFANHLPSWQVHFEAEREIQNVIAARAMEERLSTTPMHAIIAGDLDADPHHSSARLLAGRQALDGFSVCYRDAWERVHGNEPGPTFTTDNGLMADRDWPVSRIDYIFVRCGEHDGPTLSIDGCERIFVDPVDGVWASDHYGVMADLAMPSRRVPS